MMSSRSALLTVGGLVGFSLVLLCVCAIALSIVPHVTQSIDLASSTRVDRIAYIDNDHNIQVVDARGEQRIALTKNDAQSTRRAFSFPTWSPDSRHIAYVEFTLGATQREGGLYTVLAKGGQPATVFQSQAQFPFYLYWSPDNQRIAFLMEDDDGLALMLGHADGKTAVRKLETGSPFYWAWSPDGQSILLHTGGSRRDSRDARLALLWWRDAQLQVLARAPGEFEAPHFSPDGKAMLYAGVTDTNEDALYLADATGNETSAIANYRGQIAFAWSPDGKKIGWLPTSVDSRLVNEGPIFVADANGANRKQVVEKDALAFFWSPDGKQIAYLTLVLPGEGQGCGADCGRAPGMTMPAFQDIVFRFRWHLVNVEDGKTRTLVTFIPTAQFAATLPYFDQYARSTTFWSPDSRRLVYTQSEGEDIGSVWVVDVTGVEPLRRIGDGVIAAWSWK